VVTAHNINRFNIQNAAFYSPQVIYVLSLIFTIDNNFISAQHQPTLLPRGDGLGFL